MGAPSPGAAAHFRGQGALFLQPKFFEVSRIFLLFDLRLNN